MMYTHNKIILAGLLLLSSAATMATTDLCKGKTPLSCACTQVSGSDDCQHNYSYCNPTTGAYSCSTTCPAGTVATSSSYQCITPTSSGGICQKGLTFEGLSATSECVKTATKNATATKKAKPLTCPSGEKVCGIHCATSALCVGLEWRAGMPCTNAEVGLTTSKSTYDDAGVECNNIQLSQ